MGFPKTGGSSYTPQFERQRLDEDSGMAGVSGLAERDRPVQQTPKAVGAQTRESGAGLFRVRAACGRDCRDLRTGSARSAMLRVPDNGGNRTVPGEVSGVWPEGGGAPPSVVHVRLFFQLNWRDCDRFGFAMPEHRTQILIPSTEAVRSRLASNLPGL